MNDLLGQLEHSYTERLGFWKGGTVSVFGYGGGVIPRFSEVADKFPASKEFHTLRIQPPAGYHYTTDLLRQLCDIWERHGSGPRSRCTARAATSCSRAARPRTCRRRSTSSTTSASISAAPGRRCAPR